MNILFLMDSLDTIKFEKDTSYFLMQGAKTHGMRVFHCEIKDLALINDNLACRCRELEPGDWNPKDQKGFKSVNEADSVLFSEIDFVFIRKDPPFDDEYLAMTQMLDFAPDSCTVVNRPQSLRDFNEKMFAHHFSEYIPDTIITTEFIEAQSFARDHKKVVVKPIDGFGGKGIHILTTEELIKSESLFNGKRFVIQEFVEDASLGDKRILLVNGRPIGAVLRTAQTPGALNNLDQGGVASKSEVSEYELDLCSKMAPLFIEKGLFFVGIDMLGKYLTEINVTSPTGLQELSRFESKNFANEVIEDLIQLRNS